MLCEDCNKNEANFHYTEIINEQTKESHLCQECAAKKNFFNAGINIFSNGFINKNAGQKKNIPQSKKNIGEALKNEYLKCETCGLAYTEFRKRGKLGCGDCYKYFGEEINYLLTRIHNSNKHIGKRSKLARIDADTLEKIKKLQNTLEKAIKNEEYEKAIQIRDELKKITQKT